MKIMTLLLAHLLMGLVEQPENVKSLEDMKLGQSDILLRKELECGDRNNTEIRPTDGLYCPRIWDGALCWPYSKADSVVHLPCPEYVAGFKPDRFASRICMSDGSWFFHEEKNSTWTNYTACAPSKTFDTVIEMENNYHNSTNLAEFIPIIKLISRIGYSVSLTFLLVALFIMAAIKRLRCPRNNLHMHLFTSFIMRAIMALLKHNLFVEGIGLAGHIVSNDGNSYLKENDDWTCKLVTSMWQYFIMANYCWILMEGLYLHNLIFLALFSDTSGICLYVALGWGLPLIFIIPWVIIRATLENTICWNVNSNQGIFWIIRAPITLSIIINFVFFINITRILFLKLTVRHGPDARKHRYRKLTKSTMVLVPLFGVHYMAFLAMPSFGGLHEMTELVWLICDQFFTSFQGFFVAVLYCFLNGEVQQEIRKKWENWYQDHAGTSEGGRGSFLSQSLNYFSNSRSAGDRRGRRSSPPSRSPCNQRTTECTSCTTTYYNNPSNSPSPRMERTTESTNWSLCPTAASENNVSSNEKSPNVESHHEFHSSETPTALTPMLNGKVRTNSLKEKDYCKNKPENLKLLYMERMESVDLGESAV